MSSDAERQIARKFADRRREFLRLGDAINLRHGHAQPEQNGQQRQFHCEKLTTKEPTCHAEASGIIYGTRSAGGAASL